MLVYNSLTQLTNDVPKLKCISVLSIKDHSIPSKAFSKFAYSRRPEICSVFRMVDDAINKSDIFSYKSIFQKAGLTAINYIRQKFLDMISDGFRGDLVVAVEKSYWSPVL